MTALIIGSMPLEELSFLEGYLTPETIVLCADGGVNTARKHGLSVDWYVGDGDSGGYPPEGAERIVLSPEKDATDLELAVEQGFCLGCTRFLLCGCTGGRQDHHLSALFLLEVIAERGGEGIVLDPENEITYLMPGGHVIQNRPAYRYLGLIPLERKLTGVMLTGVKYPLYGAEIRRGSSRTVSNEPLPGCPANLMFTGGCCFLVRSQPVKNQKTAFA